MERVINGRVYTVLSLDTVEHVEVDRKLDRQMRDLPTAKNECSPRKRTAYMSAKVGQ